MSAAAPKRVSFGSHKSMVETLIFDIGDDFIPSEERTCVHHQQNFGQLRHSKSSTAAELSTSRLHQPTHSCMTKPGHKRSGSGGTIELDNPFALNGELRRKADLILRHSRISRADLQIVDPDSFSKPEHKEQLPPRDLEEILPLQEVPLRDDIKNEDAVTFGEKTPDRNTAATKNDASEVSDSSWHISGTLNGSEQRKQAIPEDRTLPDPNPDFQVLSECDAEFVDTVCTRTSNHEIVVVDNVVVVTSPECQQALQVKLTMGKCCNVQ